MTGLAPQVVNAEATVFRLADPSGATPDPVDFGILHVGDPAEQALSITNQAAEDGYSEALNASFGGTTGGVVASGFTLPPWNSAPTTPLWEPSPWSATRPAASNRWILMSNPAW